MIKNLLLMPICGADRPIVFLFVVMKLFLKVSLSWSIYYRSDVLSGKMRGAQIYFKLGEVAIFKI